MRPSDYKEPAEKEGSRGVLGMTQVSCLPSQGLQVACPLLPAPQEALPEAHIPLHAGSVGEKEPL